MAVANTKSTIVTNGDATPITLTNALISHGRLREQAATVETAAADDAGSVYRLFRVHSSWRVSQLWVGHDALTNMSTADIGLYDIASVSSGAVVDVNVFASAVDMSSASAGLVDRTYEADNTELDEIESAIWQRLDLTTDPDKWYDVCVTATTNDPSAAGTISALLRYTDNT